MRTIVLMAAVVMVGPGCARVQRTVSPIHVISESSAGVGAALGSGGAGHDCQQEHEECMEHCWKQRYPWPHNQPQAGWYYKRCTSDCLAQYKECVSEQEQAAKEGKKKLDFPRMEHAIGWIREHKAEVVLGTIVVVGGVAFVLTTGGAGALILVPVSFAL